MFSAIRDTFPALWRGDYTVNYTRSALIVILIDIDRYTDVIEGGIRKMDAAVQGSRTYRTVVWVAVIGWFASSASAAELMSPTQQNSLVQKYCAVCHTDAAKNGGLSLEHYDATQANPALASMMLSKLRNNAMGAAGLGIPDKATREAWVTATAAQAEGAAAWTVIHTETPESHETVLTASIVRDVAPRGQDVGAPIYRLTLACNLASHKGDIQLTWAPSPQTDRTFFVSVDGNPGTPHSLEGREEKMGNGATVTTGLAASMLNLPLPDTTLTINELFPGETVVFPLGALDQTDRRQLAVCFPATTTESLNRSR